MLCCAVLLCGSLAHIILCPAWLHYVTAALKLYLTGATLGWAVLCHAMLGYAVQCNAAVLNNAMPCCSNKQCDAVLRSL